MTGIGHNSIAAQELREYLERIERLEQQKAEIGEDVRDIYLLAKSKGFDPKTMRKVVALRKLDPAKRKEQQDLLELYAHAVGLDLI
jgi:uncharacterized protein (UPF0335 family)